MRIGNRRGPFIDYHKPGIFMITMNKLPALPDFSRLSVSHNNRLEPNVKTLYHKLGFAIYDALLNFGKITPDVAIEQYVIMPDHIHFIVRIIRENHRHLGRHLAMFKRNVFENARKRGLVRPGFDSIFVPGFNDQFLRYDRSLDVLYQYVRNNPHRLWVRKDKPENFKRINSAIIRGVECQLYGNLHLLDNPFIYPVVIHRRDTEEYLEKKKELWRYALCNGGVLVSPFISKAEKNIFKGAAQWGGKLILISNQELANREKPSKALFELCEKGQLLIIAPKMDLPPTDKDLSRAECLFMNGLAEKIALANEIFPAG